MTPGLRAREWFLLGALALAAGALAEEVGLPAGFLFGGMLVALCFALLRPGRLRMQERTFRVAQAVAGVAIGTYLQGAAFSQLGWRWVAVVLVGVATLGVTTAAGVVLARAAKMDRVSAALGMVAGGASGIVAMAEELGGDERLVAFMQYTRVLAVTALTTLAIPIAFSVHAGGGAGEADPALLGSPGGWLLVLGAGGLGALAGSWLRLPAPALLGPLIVAGAVSLSGLWPGLEVPAIVRDLAFAMIGVRVGLGFDVPELRRIAGMARPVALSIAALIAVCFLLGWLLALAIDVPLLDGYLATTPGGIFAVLPIAYGSGANTTFVVAAQGLRLVLMVLAAPLAVRAILGHGAARAADRAP